MDRRVLGLLVVLLVVAGGAALWSALGPGQGERGAGGGAVQVGTTGPAEAPATGTRGAGETGGRPGAGAGRPAPGGEGRPAAEEFVDLFSLQFRLSDRLSAADRRYITDHLTFRGVRMSATTGRGIYCKETAYALRGTVGNSGEMTVARVEVLVTFLNGNTPVGDDLTYPVNEPIMPSETRPFVACVEAPGTWSGRAASAEITGIAFTK